LFTNVMSYLWIVYFISAWHLTRILAERVLEDVMKKIGNENHGRHMVRFLLGFVMILAFSSSAFTQTQMNRVGMEIAQTDKIIDEAHRIVGESGSEQGGQYLEKAVYLQGRAKEQYSLAQQGNGGVQVSDRLGMAERLTLQARECAERAIGIVNQGGESKSYVQREIERTDQLLQQVREGLGLMSQNRMSYMLESAIATQNKARELYLQNRQKMALTATLRAREMIQRGQESIQKSEQAQRELEKTNMLADRAREMLSGMGLEETPPAFENALRLQEQAREMYENGNYDEAQQYSLRARKQILEGINKYEAQLQKENFPKVMEDVQARLERAREELGGNPNSTAEKYMERARNEIRRANEAYEGGNVQRAMNHLRRANRFLSEAAEIISP
jgi:tetratricopeptide (TPR) repeat protein